MVQSGVVKEILREYRWVIIAGLAVFAFGCIAGFLGTEVWHRAQEAGTATAWIMTAVQLDRTMQAVLEGTTAALTATARVVVTGTPTP